MSVAIFGASPSDYRPIRYAVCTGNVRELAICAAHLDHLSGVKDWTSLLKVASFRKSLGS